MGSYEVDQVQPQRFQNVVVMRHGDRIDKSEPLWTASAARPWDPPLVEGGKIRAFQTGLELRKLGFPIHRVFVSPFLRCLQTAAETVTALCFVIDDQKKTNDDVVIDPSKIKVSIEYGLCEMLNFSAIRRDVAPKDGIFSFDVLQWEAILPAGTIDTTVEPVYKELPRWLETHDGAGIRYCDMINALADKYPSENLLLVTHAKGVASAVHRFVPDVDTVYKVNYCAYSLLHRPILSGEKDSFTAGDFLGSPEEQVGMKILNGIR